MTPVCPSLSTGNSSMTTLSSFPRRWKVRARVAPRTGIRGLRRQLSCSWTCSGSWGEMRSTVEENVNYSLSLGEFICQKDRAKDSVSNVLIVTSLLEKGVFSNKGPNKETLDSTCLCSKNCHVINMDCCKKPFCRWQIIRIQIGAYPSPLKSRWVCLTNTRLVGIGGGGMHACM